MHCYAYELMQKKKHLPPKFAQSFAELGVVEVRILIRELPARRLRPHHKRVHRSLHVRLVFVRAVHSHRHGHQRPVVAFQHLRHRISDAHRELVFFVLLELAERRVRSREAGVLGVGARAGARGARGVLGHARTWGIRQTLLLLLCHFQVGI